MLLANLQLQLGFAIQLIIHCTLLFILLWGLLFGQHSADKVREVYEEQKANRSGIIEMTKAVGRLKDRISETAELPDDNFIQRINTLEENLLFISPSKNSEAHELEDSFVETVDAIRFSLNGDLFNKEQIESNLKKCEYLYQKRKQVY
jgi:regulator of PEP synthase PpsR (kinase-PPPase family)